MVFKLICIELTLQIICIFAVLNLDGNELTVKNFDQS